MGETVREIWSGENGPRERGDLEKVRDASDIVRIVGQHVALKPRGREFVGLCPFHDDHSPSMNVIPAKQIFHCFVCGTGGDVFSFVQKFHRMEFREALKFLAEQAGIELTPPRQTAGGATAGGGSEISRQDLLKASGAAAEFFRAVLKRDDLGAAARAVIERRGISSEMCERFMIGAAPDRWDGLLLTVRSKQLLPQAFVEAGLLKKREQSDGLYDTFRNRLMFPITDQLGRVIAFGGRRINDEDEPKYVNSPETRLYKKSGTLYALHQAAKEIQRAGRAIVTEGYTDVIACHQAGITNAVATLGTALTRDHAAVLRRMCDTVVLLFDGDQAGEKAAERAVEVFFGEAIDVRIATLKSVTDAKDPDELLKRDGGRELFQQAIDQSVDLLEFRFARLRSRLEGAGIAALSRAIDEEVARLVELGLKDVPPIRQKLIIRRLAEVSRVDEATIQRAIPAGRSAPVRASGQSQYGPGPSDDTERLPPIHTAPLTPAEHLLGCILCDGALFHAMEASERDLIAPGAYRWSLLSRLAETIAGLGESGSRPDLAAVLAEARDLTTKDAAVSLASRIDVETDRDRERLNRHWRECLRRATLERATTVSQEELAQRIELRRTHIAAGGDRKVLPRPR